MKYLLESLTVKIPQVLGAGLVCLTLSLSPAHALDRTNTGTNATDDRQLVVMSMEPGGLSTLKSDTSRAQLLIADPFGVVMSNILGKEDRVLRDYLTTYIPKTLTKPKFMLEFSGFGAMAGVQIPLQ